MNISLTQRFEHKIKTAAQLAEIVGPMPRSKTVIMCHGVFDVVHPGHVRHLLYAKSKADILIASLTADKHIDKGKYRPHVPEQLRAANLAAFEMVDFVVIDDNQKPLKNLGIIKPDFFAKGYEYTKGGTNPKTAEEIEVLESYGGQVLFTPGDIVYSSSRLIDLEPPEIKYEKLQLLMEREGFTFADLRATLAGMAGQRVHVVGDTIVDTVTYCAMIGGQTKTPTMSVLFESDVDFVGGAGIVSKHLSAAGAGVKFSTVLGADRLAEFVVDDLEQSGVEINAVIDPTRPTTNKNAIVAGGYRLLKLDRLENRSIGNTILADLVETIQSTPADALVYSDFRHGIFNKRTIPDFIEARRRDVYTVADSQVASRWGNITEFQGFDLITPNEREARFALADQDSPIRSLASRLYDTAGCRTLILKLGDRGVFTCQNANHDATDSFISIDSFVNHVVDPVGAGDALLAYATLAMLVSKSPAQATVLGSLAAACECEVDGNVPVGPQDVLDRLGNVEGEMTQI